MTTAKNSDNATYSTTRRATKAEAELLERVALAVDGHHVGDVAVIAAQLLTECIMHIATDKDGALAGVNAIANDMRNDIETQFWRYKLERIFRECGWKCNEM